MSETFTDILVRKERHVLILTLNRPERLNALTQRMQEELGDHFAAAGDDADVRAIVLLANGRGFCAGADIAKLEGTANADVEGQLTQYPRFTARQTGIFKPTICAVNGVCAGAGLHFVADSDIVIASDLASFTDTHVDVGQVSALEPIMLARRMPLGAVLRMVVLGRRERLSAERALALGMITEIVAPEDLERRAIELARIAADVSPAAVQKSLQAIWESYNVSLSEGERRGFEMLIRHRAHPDASEGPRAFIEKRTPQWQ